MKTLSTIVLTCILLLFTSCNTGKRVNYIVLLDNSKSISEQLLNLYIDMIANTIVLNMGRYDRLTIQFIDECAMTKAERVYSIDLDKLDFTNSRDGLNHREDSIRYRLHQYLMDSIQPAITASIKAKRAQRTDCGNYTDIVNALNGSTALITHEKNFSSPIDKVQNSAKGIDNYEYESVYIILSDMVQENRDKVLDFTQMGRMNTDQVYQKIEDIRSLGKIPDLSGCSVFIYGATASKEAGPFANRQIENIRLFWETYFKDSNAVLQAYSFDCKKEIAGFMAELKK
ncbi:MAG: hypothetical protein AB2L17_02705 [Lentimicrobium sp.]